MTIKTTTLSTEQLSYACIDTKPIDYDFSADNFGGTEGRTDGTGWCVCEGSLLPDDMETEITIEVKGLVSRELSLDTSDYAITVVDTLISEETGEEWNEETFYANDEGYDELARHFKLDGEEIRRHLDGDDFDDWQPMMNYVYPLDREPPDDWKTKVNGCTCVEIDGSYYLALTGGGMDLSWEICESYMRLGYLPPTHFASDLPRMAGRGTSETDKWIIEGCRKSLEAMRERMEYAIKRLDEHVVWAREEAS